MEPIHGNVTIVKKKDRPVHNRYGTIGPNGLRSAVVWSISRTKTNKPSILSSRFILKIVSRTQNRQREMLVFRPSCLKPMVANRNQSPMDLGPQEGKSYQYLACRSVLSQATGRWRDGRREIGSVGQAQGKQHPTQKYNGIMVPSRRVESTCNSI